MLFTNVNIIVCLWNNNAATAAQFRRLSGNVKKKEVKLIINDKANYYCIQTQSPMVLLAQHKNIIIK